MPITQKSERIENSCFNQIIQKFFCHVTMKSNVIEELILINYYLNFVNQINNNQKRQTQLFRTSMINSKNCKEENWPKALINPQKNDLRLNRVIIVIRTQFWVKHMLVTAEFCWIMINNITWTLNVRFSRNKNTCKSRLCRCPVIYSRS